MTERRIFVTPEQIDVDSMTVRFDDEKIVLQLSRVLRLKRGDAVTVLDGQGSIYQCRIEELPAKHARGAKGRATILSSQAASGEPRVKVLVAMPVLRSGRFEWAVEKLTEIGASKIVPTLFERTVVKAQDGNEDRRHAASDNEEPPSAKLTRWQSVAREAAEQCERAMIPHVVKPIKLADLVKSDLSIFSKSAVFLCAERSEAPHMERSLYNRKDSLLAKREMAIVVGPEGGFSDHELKLAQDAGFQFVSLGARILRSETAAIYALSLSMAILDE